MKCCDIKAGDMRHRASLQRKQRAPDGAGGSVITWQEYATPWCKITPKTGSERIYLDRLNAQGLSSVIMRYRSDIDDKDKFVFRGKEYQIRSVINIEERNRFTELVIEKGQAQ